MGCTYIIYRQEYSERAGRMYGQPYTWHPVARIRQRPPSSEREFHTWLWHLVQKHGPGCYRIARTQARGERVGFHGVGIFLIDEEHVTVLRRYPDVKSIPSLPQSRQLWYKKVQERERFYKRHH